MERGEESAFRCTLPTQTLLVLEHDVVQDKLPILGVHLAHRIAKGEQVMRAHHQAKLRNRELEFLQLIDHWDQADDQVAVTEDDTHVIPGHRPGMFCDRAHRG